MIALLLNHLWQSSLCVAAVGLLALALRRNGANVRFWLWFAASVKFLVPFAALTALGAYFLTPIVPPVTAPAITLMEPLAQPFSTMSLAAAPAPAAVPVPLPTVPTAGPSFAAPPLTAAPAVPTAAHLDIESALLALWASGFLIIALRWLVRWSRVRALLRAASTVQVDAPIAVKFSSSRMEPGLVGILRPVILLPQGIEQQLSAVELKAVLAHELCHWRRRDNLLAAIHMLVEASFWFFPLVWWLGARLNAERERACDESVLADGNDPQMYAEGILKVCRAYLQSHLACVAGVSGAGLKQRIDAIMENRLIPQLNVAPKFVLSASAVLALVLPLVLGLAAVPVAQMQAKAAPVPPAPRRADGAATTSANAVSNEPSRNTVPSQGTTSAPRSEAMPKGQPERLAPPSPDLSGVLPHETLVTPILVASNDARTPSGQPVVPAQPESVASPSAAVASNAQPVTPAAPNDPTAAPPLPPAGRTAPPAGSDLNGQRFTQTTCMNHLVEAQVISTRAIRRLGFVCDLRPGFSIDPGESSFQKPDRIRVGYGSCQRATCKPFVVTIDVQLADPADASRMQRGKTVRLIGDFRLVRQNDVDYVNMTNAKVVWVDPYDRPPAPGSSR